MSVCATCHRTWVYRAGVQCGRCVRAGVEHGQRPQRRTIPARGLSVTDAALALRRESSATVDALLAAAKAARLAEERRAGQRRFTIHDGWQQRPGRSTCDGELRVTAVQP